MISLLYSYSLFGFATSILLVGYLVLIKRRDETATRFFTFCVDVFGWGIGITLWSSQLFSEQTSLWIMRFSHMFSTTIPITWLHFCLAFGKRKEPFRYFYLIFYSIAAIFSLSCLTPHFISGTHEILNFKYYPSPGIIYHFFTAVFFILVPYAFWCLIVDYKNTSGPNRKQYGFLIAAMIVAFSAGSSTFLPVYHIPVPLVLIPVMLLFPYLMGVALIRYGLFDVQQIADAFQREKITALGIMAASLNHEMRNPLYIAKGKIETYKTVEQSKTKTDEMVDSVSHQLDRTLDIMQRFSDFAKPAAMNKKETVVWVDFFKDVTDLVSHALYKKNIELKTDFQEGISLLIHRRQFEEIMVNLLINASQALGEQSGIIEVKAYQSKEKFIIEVSDSGPGISDETSGQIFEPFITTKEKGTGLGLYITKQLIERNNGCISVRSERHQGTMFILEFTE